MPRDADERGAGGAYQFDQLSPGRLRLSRPHRRVASLAADRRARRLRRGYRNPACNAGDSGRSAQLHLLNDEIKTVAAPALGDTDPATARATLQAKLTAASKRLRCRRQSRPRLAAGRPLKSSRDIPPSVPIQASTLLVDETGLKLEGSADSFAAVDQAKRMLERGGNFAAIAVEHAGAGNDTSKSGISAGAHNSRTPREASDARTHTRHDCRAHRDAGKRQTAGCPRRTTVPALCGTRQTHHSAFVGGESRLGLTSGSPANKVLIRAAGAILAVIPLSTSTYAPIVGAGIAR